MQRKEPIIPDLDERGALVIRVCPPATPEPAPITADTATAGQRLILWQPSAWVFDIRGVADPYVDDTGTLYVDCVSERYWYEAQARSAVLHGEPVPADMLWVERPPPSGRDLDAPPVG